MRAAASSRVRSRRSATSALLPVSSARKRLAWLRSSSSLSPSFLPSHRMYRTRFGVGGFLISFPPGAATQPLRASSLQDELYPPLFPTPASRRPWRGSVVRSSFISLSPHLPLKSPKGAP